MEAVRSSISGRSLIAEVLELDGSSLPVGKEQFEEVKTSLKELNRKLESFSADIKKECSSSVQAIKMQLTKWSTGENETQTRIDAIRKELEAEGIKLNLPFIRKITKDASDYGAKLEDLRRKETLLRRYHGDRAAMVLARRKLKERTYQTRIGHARILEQNLRNTIVEFQVSVKYRQGKHSPDLESLVKEEMEWRTSQVPRAGLISKTLSPFEILDALDRKDQRVFSSIVDENGASVFSVQDATEILTRLNEPQVVYRLESCPLKTSLR